MGQSRTTWERRFTSGQSVGISGATTPQERCELTLWHLHQAVEAYKEDARNSPTEMMENAIWIAEISTQIQQTTARLLALAESRRRDSGARDGTTG